MAVWLLLVLCGAAAGTGVILGGLFGLVGVAVGDGMCVAIGGDPAAALRGRARVRDDLGERLPKGSHGGAG